MSDSSFNGKTTVVTGGTGALGAAVVQRLIDAGAHCHVTWLLKKELDSFALKNHPRVKLHKLDCADEGAARKFYAGVKDLWASIHLVGGFSMAAITDTPLKEFRKMFELNAATCFLCCRESVRRMRTGKGGGRIVNVAARPAAQPTGGMIAYTTAKAAVASMTRCLAEEVKKENILVNAVLPSIMDTPANRAAMPKADFKSWPKVEQVAEAIAFLASPQNALTSGALVPVYGKA